MAFQVRTLFDTTLDFISANVGNIECLNDFPEIVGKKIFNRFISLKKCESPENQVKIIHIFTTAYEGLILESIDLSESLILINEFFESFIILFRFMSEICLCSCSLGDNHELFEHIHNFCLLKKLCLRKNNLKDGAMRKITLPIRMFNKGPKLIEYLDLSDNQVSDVIVPWLDAFKNLQFLNLSGSNLTGRGVATLEKLYGFKICPMEINIHPIANKGWAILLVQRWKDICVARRENRRIKKPNAYISQKRLLMAQEKLSNLNRIETSSRTLFFRRTPWTKSNHEASSICKKALTVIEKNPVLHKSVSFHKEEITKDLFSQYL